MKIKLKKISAGLIIFASISLNLACWGSSNSNQTATPTPTEAATPEVPRGCPAGTKACGDACIPKKQNCGGN